MVIACDGGKSAPQDNASWPDWDLAGEEPDDDETGEKDESDIKDESDELTDGDDPLPDMSDLPDDLLDDADAPIPDDDTDIDEIVTTASISWNGITAWVTATVDTYRTYELSTDNTLRDNYPPDKKVTIVEEPGQMRLRSGHLMFDALFALALQEARQNSVSEITDGSFNGGQPMACDCFVTGEKWPYVWTRDTAYAAYLGLALVDPVRTMNSLLFKLSDKKATLGGGAPQIVQDTGSGGSWPVSTDRVVWALGAYETLKYLSDADRAAFLTDAYAALKNTVETDRSVAYDPHDGLYRGETSFLDWREQTYPAWTANDTVHIGMSKSLSTNQLHYRALRIAAELAFMAGESADQTRYTAWTDDLRAAIAARFAPGTTQTLMSAMKLTELNDAPLPRHDLLATALLAQWSDTIFDTGTTVGQIAFWPHTDAGAPVIWPQQPWTPIYHNRAIWPFVTALYAQAARNTANADALWRAVRTLMFGAAFNLSNMENFEFTTLANDYEDGDYSGPVVNSRRQLWSVAGFVSLVVRTLAGFDAEMYGIAVTPSLPRAARNDFFVKGDRFILYDIPYRGKKVTIDITLPPIGDANDGYYTAETVKLNGTLLNDPSAAEGDLDDENLFEIDISRHHAGVNTATVLPDTEPRTLFAPREPLVTGISSVGGHITLTLSRNGEPETDTAFTVYRNGEMVAENVTATSWSDADTLCLSAKTCCYSVSQRYLPAGHHSFPSNPQCFWGDSYERITTIAAAALTGSSGEVLATDHGKTHFSDWGTPTQTLTTTSPFAPTYTGQYYLQVEYGNGRPIDTGITACQKFIDVYDTDGLVLVTSGPVVMPHLGANDWERWGNSSFLPVFLESGKSYSFVMRDGMNMSYFAHFEPYGGAGGGTDGLNRVNLSALKVLRMTSE